MPPFWCQEKETDVKTARYDFLKTFGNIYFADCCNENNGHFSRKLILSDNTPIDVIEGVMQLMSLLSRQNFVSTQNESTESDQILYAHQH